MPATTTAPGPPPMFAIGASASLSPCTGPHGNCWRTYRTGFPMIPRNPTTPRSQTSSSMGGRRNRVSSGCRGSSRSPPVECGQLHVGEADRVDEAILRTADACNWFAAQQVLARECHAVRSLDAVPLVLRVAVHIPIRCKCLRHLHRASNARDRVEILIIARDEIERVEREMQIGSRCRQHVGQCWYDKVFGTFDVDLQQRAAGQADVSQHRPCVTQFDGCLQRSAYESVALHRAEDARPGISMSLAVQSYTLITIAEPETEQPDAIPHGVIRHHVPRQEIEICRTRLERAND